MIVTTVANILVIGSIAFMLWRQEESLLRKVYWPALVLKLFCGIALGLLYIYYYNIGDTFAYYKDGSALANVARSDAEAYIKFLWNGNDAYLIVKSLYLQEPRALFMSKITSIFCLLCADNYWLVSLYLSFVAFSGAWFLVKQLSRIDSIALPAIGAFLFLPSAVFWSSGVIKESIAMASVYFITAVFLKAWMKHPVKLWHWPLVPLALWLLWSLKYYYLAVFLPVTITGLIVKRILLPRFTAIHRWQFTLLIWLVVFTVPLYIASVVHPNFYPERFLGVIVENYRAFAAASPPEDRIVYEHLTPRASSIAFYSPKALASGLFRPFLWEAHNVMQLLVALENLGMLVLFIMALAQWKHMVNSKYRLLIFSAAVYIVLLCIFLALSTPNFGTLSRYRVGFLPFFFLLITINNPLLNKLCAFVQRSWR
ncbi:MAG TPA: hypothetical protein VIN08_18855 [Ohtaekwangia sp.]|uniref:hypothetical protein n=1 Tax=Ohtaekwangia sp. TaxID=2066019 RepID=UPI002F92141C